MTRSDETPRDLLFGLLALQTGLIDQDQLVVAFGVWSRNKGKSLAEILLDRGSIDDESRALLAAMAEKQLRLHDGDAEKSLGAVAVGRSIHEKLSTLRDAELTASLALVHSEPATRIDESPTVTIGTPTSDGQRFRVLRHHAQGGLGAVYVALDGELNREVALKQILDRHADNETSRSRFLIEAEITGGLEHPGIVPVYGLGKNSDGRPYYAMRFIRGDTLREAIAAFHGDSSLKVDPGKKSLALRKLLRRFVDVCNAIDYAHGRGVLHRDLKPGNVIVGRHGETLVVDWGLAKALGHSEPSSPTDELTLIPSSFRDPAETLPGSAIGTPAYMSPEQSVGALERLGPRSDVYSLGATLYCLLAGSPPFEGTDVGAILRKVQKGDFPPPRQVDPSIDRALEAVCLKAMAFQPEARHASARALAEDVERWMADEPTSAWLEPVSVRARRWMRRNRTLVTAASVALVVGVTGLSALAALQAKSNAALTRANEQTRAALEQSEESRLHAEAVGSFLVDAFKKPDPSLDGKDVKVAEILDQALAGLSKGFTGSKATEGALLDALGQSYLGLGLYQKAEEALRQAEKVREASEGPNHADTLKSRNNLAEVYRADGRYKESIALHEATLKQREALLGTDHPDTLTSRNNLAWAYGQAFQTRESILLHEAVLRTRERTLGTDHPDTLTSRNSLALAYSAAGRFAEAIELEQTTLKLRERRLGLDHPETLSSRFSLAVALQTAGRIEEAIRVYEDTIKLEEPKLGRDHTITLDCRNFLAWAYQAVNRDKEAEALFRENLEIRQKQAKPNSYLLSAELTGLGHILMKQSRWSEAEPLLRDCVRIRLQIIPDHWMRFSSTSMLGDSLLGQGRFADAEPLIVGGYEGMKARKEMIPAYGMSLMVEAEQRVIRLYRAWGKLDQAADWAARIGLPELPANVFEP